MKTLIFCLMIFWVAITAGAQSFGSTLYVSANTVTVRTSSGFFSSVLGTLGLGEAVTVQQNQGRWLVVRNAAGLQGWAPADAFSTRRRVPQSGSNVTVTEFALAGKGFTSDLEEILRADGELDFSVVDTMERRTISPEELRAFLREGRLAEGN